jgi:hypothetical protein
MKRLLIVTAIIELGVDYPVRQEPSEKANTDQLHNKSKGTRTMNSIRLIAI